MAVWPFVGRNNELSQLLDALVAQRGAVITGPAGVGKTTLAMTCLHQAGQRGMSLARTTATLASQGLPFGALVSILPPDAGGDGLSREDHPELLRRYGRAVIEAAGGRPLVVFVDDAHLLDNGSATLVHQLALTGAITVLATVRSGETVPDPVLSLWKDGPAERIEVGCLDDATTEELLLAVLGGPLDGASLRHLLHRCRGNPLFLRELVTGALESEALVDDGGLWHLQGGFQPSARLVELVAMRLGHLSESERAVLELLALGEPLEPTQLSELSHPAAVETLERRGLIASRTDGRRVQVRLAHPVYGEVVRVGITARREQDIARSLAEVIEAGGPLREDTLRVASLRLVGGGGSVELFTAGAMVSRARHDHALTERLARAAVEGGAGFESRFVAAEAAHFQGRHNEAEHELAAMGAGATSDAERASVALLRFDNAYLLRGRADFRLLDDAADAIDDPFWGDQVRSRHLFALSFSSGPRATVEAAPDLLGGPPTGPLSVAYFVVGFSLGRLGRLDEALTLLTPLPDREAMPATDESWGAWAVFVVR